MLASHRGPDNRLLDRVRQALRARHMSYRTEEAYVAWIRRFIFFHDKRHPERWAAEKLSRVTNRKGHRSDDVR